MPKLNLDTLTDITANALIVHEDSKPLTERFADEYETIHSLIIDKGKSNVHIAQYLGVSYGTLQRNKFLMQKIQEIRHERLELQTTEIENQLFKSAQEHKVKERITEVRQYANGKTSMTITTEHEKVIPASNQSLQYFLGNKKPSEWQNVSKVVQVSTDKTDGILANMKQIIDTALQETFQPAQVIEDKITGDTDNEDA